MVACVGFQTCRQAATISRMAPALQRQHKEELKEWPERRRVGIINNITNRILINQACSSISAIKTPNTSRQFTSGRDITATKTPPVRSRKCTVFPFPPKHKIVHTPVAAKDWLANQNGAEKDPLSAISTVRALLLTGLLCWPPLLLLLLQCPPQALVVPAELTWMPPSQAAVAEDIHATCRGPGQEAAVQDKGETKYQAPSSAAAATCELPALLPLPYAACVGAPVRTGKGPLTAAVRPSKAVAHALQRVSSTRLSRSNSQSSKQGTAVGNA